MVRMCACVSGTHFAFINWNSSTLISARAHIQISTQHDLRLKFWGRYQYEQLYNDICRRSRPLVSCVRSDQPPRYQDTQPIARLRRAARCNPKLRALPSSSAGTLPSYPGQAACTKDRLARSKIPTLRLSGKLPINCQ